MNSIGRVFDDEADESNDPRGVDDWGVNAWVFGRVFTVAGILAAMLGRTADLVSRKGTLGKLG